MNSPSEPFIGRGEDIRELNFLLEERAIMAMMVGRRRVGKTTLLIEWMKRSGRPHIYWMAKTATAQVLRDELTKKIWQWAHPHMQAIQPPVFLEWGQLFRELGTLIDASEKPLILVIDEFAIGVESDRSLPSYLQEAWDHVLKIRALTIVLAGSHIGMMDELQQYKAPLYGRITARIVLKPLPFAAVEDFLPRATPVDRMAAYAILGGIPHYLERLRSSRSVIDSIKENLFRKVGFFRSEPDQILTELTKDSGRYMSVIRSVAQGKRTSGEIADALRMGTGDITSYVKRLRDMGLIERRLPVSVPAEERDASLRGRYHLSDAYLRFYYRFVEPYAEQIEQGLLDLVWERVAEQIRAYIGQGTFEDVCRDWTLLQAQQNALPFAPELVGSEWNSQAQIDVCAINHRERQMLIGECKWTGERISRGQVTEMIGKTPKVLPGSDWTAHYMMFSRSGFTPDALAEIKHNGGRAVTFADLDRQLRSAFLVESAPR